MGDTPAIPSEYIPGLLSLGSTYNVLNGKYADSKSTMRQVVDWTKGQARVQEFGGNNYRLPSTVNFVLDTNSDFRSFYGKSTVEYSKSLSAHAGLEANISGFSASVSTEFSESQREDLSHAFTRVSYVVARYNLSLPSIEERRPLLKPWFVNDLDNMNPLELYKVYGTHLLRSLTVGGRATVLFCTDTRTYSSATTLEDAAKLSASYLIKSGRVELSVSQKEAMDEFNESSEMSVVTKGGDPSYGNAHFLKNVKEWTKSIDNFPDFVDFGPLPCFVGIWELATTQARRDALQTAYTQFTTYYTQDLSLPGPYLHARQSEDFDGEEDAFMGIGIGHIVIKFPATRTDGWYFISPTLAGGPCTLAKELVPGALAPVKWVEVFVAPYYDEKVTRVWKAVPPTSDYVALGFVAMSGKSASQIPLQPPAALAGQFRAVHKRALTVDTNGVGDNLIFQGPQNHLVFAVGARYWLTDVKIPPPEDCFVLDPKVAVLDWDN